jgi:hypothetical protein
MNIFGRFKYEGKLINSGEIRRFYQQSTVFTDFTTLLNPSAIPYVQFTEIDFDFGVKNVIEKMLFLEKKN